MVNDVTACYIVWDIERIRKPIQLISNQFQTVRVSS